MRGIGLVFLLSCICPDSRPSLVNINCHTSGMDAPCTDEFRADVAQPASNAAFLGRNTGDEALQRKHGSTFLEHIKLLLLQVLH